MNEYLLRALAAAREAEDALDAAWREASRDAGHGLVHAVELFIMVRTLRAQIEQLCEIVGIMKTPNEDAQ